MLTRCGTGKDALITVFFPTTLIVRVLVIDGSPLGPSVSLSMFVSVYVPVSKRIVFSGCPVAFA
jgi:hypothetical protein